MTAKKSASSSAIVAPAEQPRNRPSTNPKATEAHKGAQDGEEVILPDIFRAVARGGRREDEQGIDDHEAHPADRERYDDGNDDREKRFLCA